MAKHSLLGITEKKAENISEWYTQVIQKAELADYSSVSGCIVYRPYSYAIWEKIKDYLDHKIKKSGVKNAYFPLLIPEKLLTKESQHVEGFSPEVAWVTHAGSSQLSERLAIRPTSETIMYDSYSKWIRSYKDLPLRINQWNNVVRWEFKYAVPFLRGREFLWQEGHTVFATKKEADDEVKEILDYYAEVFEDLCAIPVIKGRKSEKEKFAGAIYTDSVETFLPNNKAIQGATSHCLGQNFAKAFDIKYVDDKGVEHYAWQNSWGLSTRTIGVLILMHGDDKGLVLPPKVAPIHVAIVPILFDKTKEMTLKIAREIKESLSDYSVELDDRDGYTPGFKFNEWELKGVPIRIELGPRDIENKQAVMVRRDTGEKEFVKFSALPDRIEKTLESIQKNLFDKAKTHIDESMVSAKKWDEFEKLAKKKRLVLAPHCGDGLCEDYVKEKLGGVKSLNAPFNQKTKGKCVHCGKKAKYNILWAKSY